VPPTECALIEADLERLKSLINDAGERLLISFNQVAAVLPTLAASETQRSQVIEAVHSAVTALQFPGYGDPADQGMRSGGCRYSKSGCVRCRMRPRAGLHLGPYAPGAAR